MPVAKTYANFTIDGEPFKENNRMYVNVITPKGVKKVRWYSDVEYNRMYPAAKVEPQFNAKHAFGFDNGYIYLYKGSNVEHWAEKNRMNIWYNLLFDYYTPGKFNLPILDEGIEPIKLTWEEIENKTDDEVRAYVLSLISNGTTSSTSNFVGAIGEWIEKEVNIKENTTRTSHFGDKHTHIMSDAEGNTYLWETSAKSLEIGMEVKLKMRIKEHKEINEEKVTVVWYCKVI